MAFILADKRLLSGRENSNQLAMLLVRYAYGKAFHFHYFLYIDLRSKTKCTT